MGYITGNDPIHPITGGMSAADLCDHNFDTGLTIRQEFARTAMGAMMPLYWDPLGAWSLESIAADAVKMADALIAELNKPKT